GTVLTGTVLTGTVLTGTVLTGTVLTGTVLTATDLAGWALDLNIERFFDTLDRGKLREILGARLRDGWKVTIDSTG
ncbi:MAG: pentapeptide repeat-containing protein, partial [Holophagales bacterium]|nr:pentapeptide repeat-containing protein [Holophagales bacterium]